MNSFSIQEYKYEYEHQQVLDSYKQWLSRDLYANLFTDKVDDLAFLQKLSFFQAEGIRHDIGVHAAVTHASIQSAGNMVGQKIQSAASLISSSLDDGFSLMNNRMVEINSNLGVIGQGINSVNQTMQQGNQILAGINKGINQVNHNIMAGMAALSSNIAQAATAIRFSLQTIHGTMQLILDELRIPESQRERRYHIEEGMKYFNKGMQSGDCLYFDDALDEFTKATSIERKDFFSWYYTGMIHLYSQDHLDIDKALFAFDEYTHYADALLQRHELFDEALMMKAECWYLKQDSNKAYQLIKELIPVNNKAALRAMKYLSASTNEDTKKQAVEILETLMQENPYIVMQVLEDYDILSNDHILTYINEYKDKIKKEIAEQLIIANSKMESLKKESFFKNDSLCNEFEDLKSKANKKIGVVDALVLKEKATKMLQKIKNEEPDWIILRLKDLEVSFVDKGDYIVLRQAVLGIKMIEKVSSPYEMTWDQAMQYARNLRKGGFNDWRVPTKEELKFIYKIKDICGINKNDSYFWSSSVPSVSPGYAWNVSFYSGYVGSDYKDGSSYVRCVR